MNACRDDPIPDPTLVLANWAALSVFGREGASGRSGYVLDGVELSLRSFALLFAEIDWLVTLFDNTI